MIPKYEPQSLPPGLGQALREYLRMTPSTQVKNPAAAAAFLRSRHIATLWGGTELPSLHEAVSGESVPRPGLVSSSAIGQAWVWSKGLAESREFVLVKLFRRRATFVARPLWRALVELAPPDPEALVQAGQISTAARQIAAFLLKEGPTNTLELQQALPRQFPILPKSLKKGLRELEEELIICPERFADHHNGKDVNTWELLRRSLARKGSASFPGGPSAAVACLLEAAVRAAGVVDVREQNHWFPRWKHQCRQALCVLIEEGKIRVIDEKHPSQIAWRGLRSKVTDAA